MQQFFCQFCGRQVFHNMACICGNGFVQPVTAPPPYPQQVYVPYPPVNAKVKKPPGQTMIKVASIVSIVFASIGTLATIPLYGTFRTASTGELFEFLVLALILAMSIASLLMAKDKSKASVILVFGIVTWVLLMVSRVVIPREPLFLIFGTQATLYIVGAVNRMYAKR